jgi:hypothetical protein
MYLCFIETSAFEENKKIYLIIMQAMRAREKPNKKKSNIDSSFS